MLSQEMSSQTISAHLSVFFFFQAEDGIRDLTVTGVQTCALPISALHLRPQILHRAQLQLLYSSFRLSKPLRNFLYASLFHESVEHHLLLNRRKLLHQPEQLGAMLNRAHLGGLHNEIVRRFRRIVWGR